MRALLLLALLAIVSCNLKSDKPFVTKEKLDNLSSYSSFEIYSYEEHPFKDSQNRMLNNSLV